MIKILCVELFNDQNMHQRQRLETALSSLLY